MATVPMPHSRIVLTVASSSSQPLVIILVTIPLLFKRWASSGQSLRVSGSPTERVIHCKPNFPRSSQRARACSVLNSSGKAVAQAEPQCIQRILQATVVSHTAVSALYSVILVSLFSRHKKRQAPHYISRASLPFSLSILCFKVRRVTPV